MEKSKSRILNQLRNVADAFMRYPVSILCAAILSIVLFITIERRYPDSNLISSLILAFGFGIFLNMAIAVALQRFRKDTLTFWLVSGAGLAATIGVWMLLYFPADSISSIGVARISAASSISFIAFMLIASVKADRYDTNHMVYMTLKSFFISLLYFLVLWAGLSLVAFSVEKLIYSQLDSDIYAHIAIIGMFVSYIFFLANFPCFNKEECDERIQGAIKQPRFIEILLQYILIPIQLILSLVFFIWAIRIVAVGTVATFFEITFIFNAFSIVGIILYFLISHYENFLAKLYRRVFPIAAIVFLAFLTYKIYLEIAEHGLRTNSYFVILLWILTAFSSVLFIFRQKEKNWMCLALACILIGISVMPAIGYEDFPVNMQIARLEWILNKNDMLKDGEIVPNPNISNEDKSTITDTVQYLYSYRNRNNKKPKFLMDKDVNQNFRQIFGFESNIYIPNNNASIWANLNTNFIDISEYDYAIYENIYSRTAVIEGSKGKYEITNTNNGKDYKITIEKNGKKLIDMKIETFCKDIVEKYKDQNMDDYKSIDLDVSEMSYKTQEDGLKVMILFSNININYNKSTSEIEYCSASIQGIYIAEE